MRKCGNLLVIIYECYQKVPGLGSVLAAISLKIVPLGMYIAIPSFFFFHASKAPCKSFYLMLSRTGCDSLWISGIVSKRRRSFSIILHLGNKVILLMKVRSSLSFSCSSRHQSTVGE
jgi:hypothetical protein